MRIYRYIASLTLVTVVGLGAWLYVTTATQSDPRTVSEPLTPAVHAEQPVAIQYAGEKEAIRAAVERALRLHTEMTVPKTANPGDGPSKAELALQKSTNSAALQDVFGPRMIDREMAALDKAITLQGSGQFRVLGGGMKNLNVFSIDIDPSGLTATVTGRVETWSKMSLKTPDGKWRPAEPHNVIDFGMTLATASAITKKWLVESFDFEFTPETHP